MPDIIVAWDSTTGPRTIQADQTHTAMYQIIVEQRARLVILQRANDDLYRLNIALNNRQPARPSLLDRLARWLGFLRG